MGVGQNFLMHPAKLCARQGRRTTLLFSQLAILISVHDASNGERDALPRERQETRTEASATIKSTHRCLTSTKQLRHHRRHGLRRLFRSEVAAIGNGGECRAGNCSLQLSSELERQERVMRAPHQCRRGNDVA